MGSLRKICLAMILVILCLPFRVFAVGETEDSENVNLTVKVDYYHEGATGGNLSLYYIGAVDQNGKIMPEGVFSEKLSSILFEINDTEEARELAQTVAAFVEANDVSADRTAVPAEDGNCVFSGLKKGVWLLMGEACISGDKQFVPEPVIMILPLQSQGGKEAAVVLKYEEHPLSDETITLQVVKIWQTGENPKVRPTEITVVLLENGREVDSVQLNVESGWKHTWTGLKSSSVWSVAERDVPSGYTVRISKEGMTFRIVNSLRTPPPEKPQDPRLPQTGMLLWPIPVLFCSGLILLIIALYCRIRRKS